jgi:predicted acyl esterase
MTQNTTVVGSGAVYLYVRSSTPDVDLQATVSEVRPDGQETFVQNGYLRASDRVLDHTSTGVMKQPSTSLEPVMTLRPKDAHAMPAGKFTLVAVPLYYEGHAYRAGSRIRVTIAAPAGNQPVWAFANTTPGKASKVELALGPVGSKAPSRLVLPVIPGQTIPTGYPACPSLRNEPCRQYAPAQNPVLRGTAKVVAMPKSVY